jgi:hypothetical protein
MQLPDIDFLILVVHMLGLYLLAAAAEVNCQSPAASRGYRIGTTRLTNNKNLLVGDIISLTSGVYYLSPILIFILIFIFSNFITFRPTAFIPSQPLIKRNQIPRG